MRRAARQIVPDDESREARPLRRAHVLAVVPAFNEAGSVGRVVRELGEVRLGTHSLDLVVVDDGSSDDTRARAFEAGACVVSLPYNLGIGLAVQTGFRFALARGADVVVQVDGDGQHPPTELEKLLPPLLTGRADVVVGTRFARARRDGLESTTALRWLAGRLLGVTVRFLTGQTLTDTTSGFRAFNRGAAEFLADHYPDDYPEVQALVTLARHGFRIVEVPVKMRPRLSGKSSINWWRAIYYVVKVTFASFMDRVRR